MARRQRPQASKKHLAPAAAAACAGAQPPRKHLAVHACELAVEPHLQILRRNRRPLLLRLEHAHRSALENHVHRSPRLGSRRSLIVRVGITHYPGRVASSSTPSLWLCCRAIEIELQIGSTACVRMAGQIDRIPRDDRPERPQSHASMNRLQTFAAVSIAVGVAVLGLKYTLPM